MADFETVAKVSEIAPGEMKLINVAGNQVVIANVDRAFYAFGNECTHKGGPLVEGELSGDGVTCPWHNTVFNVKTGQPSSGPGTEPVPTYELRIEGEEIRIAKT